MFRTTIWLAAVACVALIAYDASSQDRKAKTTSAFSQPPKGAAQPDAKRFANQVTVATLNRFHLALVARMMLNMPPDLNLTVQYQGLVGIDNGRQTGIRLHGSIGSPLEWSVFDENFGVFTIAMSPQRTADTVCTCRMENQIVFVSVSFIRDHETVNAKALDEVLPELGKRSVRDVVRLLEGEPTDLEKP